MPTEEDFASAAAITAPDSPMSWQEAMASELYRDLSTAKVAVGDVAPDFSLPEYEAGSGGLAPTGGTVTLSALRGRPVVLVFGSYT